MEGGTVRLRCTGSGYPRPTIHWERDGKELTSDNKISISGRELVIRSATIDDSGIYTCVVKNSREEASAVTIVQVVMQRKYQAPQGGLFCRNLIRITSNVIRFNACWNNCQ